MRASGMRLMMRGTSAGSRVRSSAEIGPALHPPQPAAARAFASRELREAASNDLLHCMSTSESGDDQSATFLHVGPSGECWTGSSIFAAKHLQPDYVKSIKLESSRTVSIESLVEEIEDNPLLGQQIYDQERIPQSLLRRHLLVGPIADEVKD